MTTQTATLHRFCQMSGVIAAIALALLLLGTATGRNALATIYLQSAESLTHAAHVHGFPLDRFHPTCPQCI
jgi:hypothetical protein